MAALHWGETDRDSLDAVLPRSLLLCPLLAPLLAIALSLPDTTWAAPGCRQGPDVRIWTAPLEPRPDRPLKVMAVATDSDIAELLVTDPKGHRSRLPALRGGGPPWSLRGVLARPTGGSYRVEAERGGRILACTEVAVGSGRGERGSGKWDLANEALYSAWIEHLFDAPPERSLRFPSLEPVLRDPGRNFLHDYLGAGEDRQLPAEPDCADLPYFLRAYFAWKLGLPISYRSCSRGGRSSPPRCKAPEIVSTFVHSHAPAGHFRNLSRDIMNRVHSGCGRTALDDEATDFYPVPLERWTLWPGTLYADPYGHILILVKWVPQRPGRSGLLLAVDAQPDNSITRKRFWEGTFLFARTPSAGAGFKTYRSPASTGSKGQARPTPNNALDGRTGLPPYSTEQARLAPEDFYARMEQLINPQGLDPEAAYSATLEALMEQLEARVTSVNNGEKHVRNHQRTIPMPRGPTIFETTGPWEDYSTPSRDMRLLIAMKVLDGLPQRIRRYPELFVLQGESPSTAASRIERIHDKRSRERSITYTRSDGSDWRLSLQNIYDRRPELEIAYNPNDCVERRWGASPGSPDYATCRRQAPAAQRARMEAYRLWFRDTRRPPR